MIFLEQLTFEMQQQQVSLTKQIHKNKTEAYELETAVVSEAKTTNNVQNHQMDNQSSIHQTNPQNTHHQNRKSSFYKEKSINDSKHENKMMKSRADQKIQITQMPDNLKNNERQHSERQKSSDSSLSSNQKKAKDKNVRDKTKEETQNKKGQSQSSSESKSSSSNQSSSSHRPQQKKQFKLQNYKVEPVLKNKNEEVKINKQTNTKAVVKNINKQSGQPISKRPQTRQKKVKDSDEESEYAPNKRQAMKIRKNKQQNKKKISEDQDAKQDIKPAQKIKNKNASGLKNVISKPSASSKLISAKPLQNKEKKASQKSESQNDKKIVKQRNLRMKKPMDYKRIQEEQINQSLGEKIPYRGRFKQISKMSLPATVEASLKKIINNIPTQKKQETQQMEAEQNKDKKMQQKNTILSERPKIMKQQLPISESKENNILNKIDNEKMDVQNKNQTMVLNGTNVEVNIPEIHRTIRSREQYQRGNQNTKKNNQLALQSRIIVESIMIKMDKKNYLNFNLGHSAEEIKQVMKNYYQLFQHASCCHQFNEGFIRKKKIIEKQQQSSSSDEQIAEKQSIQMVKIEDSAPKGTSSDKNFITVNKSRNMKNVGSNKSSRKRKVAILSEDSEEIIIKRPSSKRSRQERD